MGTICSKHSAAAVVVGKSNGGDDNTEVPLVGAMHGKASEPNGVKASTREQGTRHGVLFVQEEKAGIEHENRILIVFVLSLLVFNLALIHPPVFTMKYASDRRRAKLNKGGERNGS